jgi:electron transfer flavoprotein beta subunit
MGVDRGILISDPALKGSDTLVTSRVLAAAVKRIGKFDLLFFGTRTSDSDTGQVGPQTATLLGVPFISGVKQIDGQLENWTVVRGMDEWEETWRLSSPWAASINQHAYTPRSIGLDCLSQVFDHINIIEWSLTDLDLAAEDVGLAGSPTRVVALKKLKRDRKCFMLEGDAQMQVAELVTYLSKAGVLA